MEKTLKELLRTSNNTTCFHNFYEQLFLLKSENGAERRCLWAEEKFETHRRSRRFWWWPVYSWRRAWWARMSAVMKNMADVCVTLFIGILLFFFEFLFTLHGDGGDAMMDETWWSIFLLLENYLSSLSRRLFFFVRWVCFGTQQPSVEFGWEMFKESSQPWAKIPCSKPSNWLMRSFCLLALTFTIHHT